MIVVGQDYFTFLEAMSGIGIIPLGWIDLMSLVPQTT